MSGSETRYWISLPFATFAIVARGGRIVEAAPIAKWCLGKSEYDAVTYYQKRGARVEGRGSE